MPAYLIVYIGATYNAAGSGAFICCLHLRALGSNMFATTLVNADDTLSTFAEPCLRCNEVLMA